MKKYLVIAAMLLGLCLVGTPSAQNAKISELPALTSPSGDDLLVLVDDPAGTPVTKKNTVTNFFAARSLADLGTKSAAALDSGELNDARLSSNVPLKNAAATIAGEWDFTPGVTERGRSVRVGEWQDVTYDSGNFTVTNGSGTWTVDSGDQSVYRYALIGKTMILQITLNTTSITGQVKFAAMAIPGGFTAAKHVWGTAYLYDNSSTVFSVAGTRVGIVSGKVEMFKGDQADWAAATNTTYVRVNITFEVN